MSGRQSLFHRAGQQYAGTAANANPDPQCNQPGCQQPVVNPHSPAWKLASRMRWIEVSSPAHWLSEIDLCPLLIVLLHLQVTVYTDGNLPLEYVHVDVSRANHPRRGSQGRASQLNSLRQAACFRQLLRVAAGLRSWEITYYGGKSRSTPW